MNRYLAVGLLLLLLFCQYSCSVVPQLIWSQEDITARQEQPGANRLILIASTESEFKSTLIDQIIETYQDRDISINVIGLSNLENENPADYAAVILMNTCMAWDMDMDVNAYLRKYPDQDNIVILTTSGDGAWLPKKKGRRFDAVSSASKMADIDQVASEITGKIDRFLE